MAAIHVMCQTGTLLERLKQALILQRFLIILTATRREVGESMVAKKHVEAKWFLGCVFLLYPLRPQCVAR